MEKYYSILGQLKESYRQCGTVRFVSASLMLGFTCIGLHIMLEDLAISMMKCFWDIFQYSQNHHLFVWINTFCNMIFVEIWTVVEIILQIPITDLSHLGSTHWIWEISNPWVAFMDDYHPC